jgi:ATP-dependent Zn protease
MDEIYNEVYRQLKLSFSDLPVPYRMITSPQVKRDVVNRRWINYDTAFVSTTKKNNIKSHSEKITNLYSVGTHNGNSQYYFTSIESAVQNAVVFAQSILDENEIKEYEIQETFHITTIINMVLVILLFLILIYIGKKLDS